MASNVIRAIVVRTLMRRAFSMSCVRRDAGPALTDDPNVNTMFYESMITPLPPQPRLWCTTPELKALKNKEQGDWKSLSEEEMKQLYNSYFSMTVADMERGSDLWKHVVGSVMFALGLAFCIHLFIHTYINPPYLNTVTDQEWVRASIKKMLQQHQGEITGYASKWDYENNRWKK